MSNFILTKSTQKQTPYHCVGSRSCNANPKSQDVKHNLLPIPHEVSQLLSNIVIIIWKRCVSSILELLVVLLLLFLVNVHLWWGQSQLFHKVQLLIPVLVHRLAKWGILVSQM